MRPGRRERHRAPAASAARESSHSSAASQFRLAHAYMHACVSFVCSPTSPPKSACPGVSTMLMWYSFWSPGFFHMMDVPERKKKTNKTQQQHRANSGARGGMSGTNSWGQQEERKRRVGQERKMEERCCGGKGAIVRVVVRVCLRHFLCSSQGSIPRGDGAQHGPKLVHQGTTKRGTGGRAGGRAGAEQKGGGAESAAARRLRVCVACDCVRTL